MHWEGKLQIRLPWPDKKLFPNWKRSHHWTQYRPAERKAREDGCIATCAAISHDKRLQIVSGGTIKLHVVFTPPDRRKRDDDGMIGAFKNWRDGIADAFKCDDNRFRCTYEIAEPKAPGGVLVTCNLPGDGV